MNNEEIYFGELIEDENFSGYTFMNQPENYIELHPDSKNEVGYYDLSGTNVFRLYVTKKPNFINKFFVKFLFGWNYHEME